MQQIKEYKESKMLHKRLQNAIELDHFNEFLSLKQYYQMRLQLKMNQMKLRLEQAKCIVNDAANNTAQNFDDRRNTK